MFVTVASHGFEDGGLRYHLNAKHGKVIGRIVASLPHTDISLTKLNPGLRYLNGTFGNVTEPDDTSINGFTAEFQAHKQSYGSVNMDNPFSGCCIGNVLAIGARITGEGNKRYVLHEWDAFGNGDQVVDKSCGSPALDDEGRVAGLFRFKQKDSAECLCVAVGEMRELGYEICGGLQVF